MKCRQSCAACCIAPSINTPIPNMKEGKAAGVPCINLDLETLQCTIWQQHNYPDLCRQFQAEESVCGTNRDEAIQIITLLEVSTLPNDGSR